jgi:dsRNA-specific ribonuclease
MLQLGYHYRAWLAEHQSIRQLLGNGHVLTVHVKIMSALHHKTAKCLLGRVYQRLKLPAPVYTVSDETVHNEYEAMCKIAAVRTEDCSFDEHAFAGHASSKRMAISAAACQAWTFVQKSGLTDSRAIKSPENVEEVLTSILSNQVRH